MILHYTCIHSLLIANRNWSVFRKRFSNWIIFSTRALHIITFLAVINGKQSESVLFISEYQHHWGQTCACSLIHSLHSSELCKTLRRTTCQNLNEQDFTLTGCIIHFTQEIYGKEEIIMKEGAHTGFSLLCSRNKKCIYLLLQFLKYRNLNLAFSLKQEKENVDKLSQQLNSFTFLLWFLCIHTQRNVITKSTRPRNLFIQKMFIDIIVSGCHMNQRM